MRAWFVNATAALRVLLVVSVLTGVLYPLGVLVVAQIAAPGAANGSLVNVDHHVVGSALLAQSFTDASGRPLAQWFQERPSATSYDAMASGASNLGPSSKKLVALIEERRAEIAAFEHVAPGNVPPDAVTASGSGLDPEISIAYAQLQAPRVATARHLSLRVVESLIRANTRGRVLGFLGEPGVDVLTLNVALARLGS